MKDENKTKEQLIDELAELRQRISEFEGSETDRKQARERIKHLNVVLRAVRDVSSLITKEGDRDKLIKGVCESLIETRGYFNAWIVLLDETGGLVATAEAGLGNDFLPMIDYLNRGELAHCAHRALKQSEIVVTEDPFSTCVSCPLSAEYGGRGGMSTGLEFGGKVYGVLTVSIPKDFVSDREEQALFKGIASDITYALHALEVEEEREWTEKTLKESEEFSSSLLHNSPHPVIVINPDSSVRYVNPSLEGITGFSSKELIDRKAPYPWWTEETLPKTRRDFKEAFQKGARYLEEAFKRKNGERFWVEITSIPVRSDGELKYYLANWTDITERKRGMEALQESEKQLRFLSSQLLKAQENERKRIAQELHDGIGQTLSAIKFGVEDALSGLAKGTAAPAGKALESVIPMVKNGIEEVRRICTDLRPPILDDLGLLATISWFCREFQTIYSGIRIEKEIDIEEREVPDILKTVIYRVLQEAFNNVAKHSKADLVRLYLRKTEDTIYLFIEDNGPGFDLRDAISAESSKRGLGLASMKERIEHSGGSFSIESIRGTGTIIRASWQRK